MKDRVYAIGVDIGGSHVTAGVINVSTAELLSNSIQSRSIQHTEPSSLLVSTWVQTIKAAMSCVPVQVVCGLGIGLPGDFDYANGIALYAQGKFTQLYGLDFKKLIGQQLRPLSLLPIRFINDASAFAIGESWCGAGVGQRRLLALTLGTGLGSSFIIDGEVIESGSGIPTDGELFDKQFRNSIADDYFSSRWFLKEYNDQTGKTVDGVKELAEKARSGDQVTLNIFRLFGINLGKFLAPFLHASQIDTIILGGSIAKSSALFKDSLLNMLSPLPIRLLPSQLTDTSALFGAVYSFVLDEHSHQI